MEWCPTASWQQKEGIEWCEERGKVGQLDSPLVGRHETAGTGDIMPITGSPLLSRPQQMCRLRAQLKMV